MWCHRACKVGTNAVVVSRPIKSTCAMRGSEPEKGGIHRRRTSSQSTTSSAGGGSGRLTSPDSPSDKRAVKKFFIKNLVLVSYPQTSTHNHNGLIMVRASTDLG